MKTLYKFYDFINEELFDAELPAAEIHLLGKDSHKIMGFEIDGLCIGLDDYEYWIGIHEDLNIYDSFYTLVHEMIHVWQLENGKHMNHSGWFKVWEKKALTYINLNEEEIKCLAQNI